MIRATYLLPLLPLVLSAPAPAIDSHAVPELSVAHWQSIQSGVYDSLRSLSTWSWNKAEQVVDDLSTPVGTLGDESLTIWQQLKADPHSFSKLTEIIEFEGGKALEYLDDKDLQITFFAPNNDGLTPPKHHHRHHEGDDDGDDVALFELLHQPSLSAVSAALVAEPSLMINDDDDDDKKKHRKEIFKFIVGEVLKYHGLAKVYTASELAQNNTVATVLKARDGSFGGQHRRIRIEKSLLPPTLKINHYAKVTVADGKARNGIVHVLDHPLIPPPSLLDLAYLFPELFATFTSSIGKVDAKVKYGWQYDPAGSEEKKPKFVGTGLATIFAPTNAAFAAIPHDLKFYLFSPFGNHALEKLLQYHYLPDTLLLSEFFYSEHKHESEMVEFGSSDPGFHKEYTLHTALPNATVHVQIKKTRLLPIEGATKTSFKVNGQQVFSYDDFAANGAGHAINLPLVPPHKHHDHHGVDISAVDSWENWQEWFPAWANAQL